MITKRDFYGLLVRFRELIYDLQNEVLYRIKLQYAHYISETRQIYFCKIIKCGGGGGDPANFQISVPARVLGKQE